MALVSVRAWPGAVGKGSLSRSFMLKSRRSKLARGFPVTPVQSRQVTPRERVRIRKVLENAGYDIRRLECKFIGVTG